MNNPLAAARSTFENMGRLAPLLVATLVCSFLSSAAPGIIYVQSNSATPQTPQSVVTVNVAAAQTAGNLNVVVVGWNDATAAVTSVMDTSGNTYTRAVGPTAYFTSL